MELDEALKNWFKDVSKNTQLTVKEKSQITEAGAKVLSDKLSEVTKTKHYRPHNSSNTEIHLADSVTYTATDIDGEKNGISTVGFIYSKAGKKYSKGHIARFLNDGTVKIRADHFIDNARDEAKNAVFEAEIKEYQKIMRKKG